MTGTATLTLPQQEALAAAREGDLLRRRGARYVARGERVLPSTVDRLEALGLITWVSDGDVAKAIVK